MKYWKNGILKRKHRRISGKMELAHRVIMAEFIGRPLHKNEIVHHINGNPLDNRIENLLITYKQDHVIRHIGGERHYKSTLNDSIVRHIKLLLALGVRLKKVSELFNLDNRHVGGIKYGRIWKHIPLITKPHLRRY